MLKKRVGCFYKLKKQLTGIKRPYILKNILWDSVYLPFIKMMMDKKSEEFYARLKEELAGSADWPAVYLFKFIVPSDKNKILEVENAFDNMGAVIETNQSKTGKYTSVSINVKMQGPDAIVQKYQQLSGIEGIISL